MDCKLAQALRDVAESESQMAFERKILLSDKRTLFSYPFKTKNNKQVARVFETLGFDNVEIQEDGISLKSSKSFIMDDGQYVIKDKKNKRLMGAYDNWDYPSIKDYLDEVHNKKYKSDEKALEDYDVISLIDYLQDMLKEGEVLAYLETETSYYNNNAYATIISKTDKRVFDLRLIMDNYLFNIDGRISLYKIMADTYKGD